VGQGVVADGEAVEAVEAEVGQAQVRKTERHVVGGTDGEVMVW
jgi:hypothetical protein